MLLFFVEPSRNLDQHAHNLVARALAAYVGQPHLRQAKHLAMLRAGRDSYVGSARERGHFEFGSEGRLRKAKRHIAEQIVAVPLEERMLFDLHDTVQVASGPAVVARLAFAAQSNGLTVVDTGGDLYRDEAMLLRPAAAATFLARLAEGTAAAATIRTGGDDARGEETNAAASLDLTVAAAGLAGLDF